jgi:CRISPR-associated protein Cas2
MAKKESTQPAAATEPRNRRQWIVVSYDVADDKRRNRVMKAVEGYGARAQYSVFECDIKPEDADKLLARLQALIDSKADDIRFYPLCESCQAKMRLLGRGASYRRRSFKIV